MWLLRGVGENFKNLSNWWIIQNYFWKFQIYFDTKLNCKKKIKFYKLFYVFFFHHFFETTLRTIHALHEWEKLLRQIRTQSDLFPNGREYRPEYQMLSYELRFWLLPQTMTCTNLITKKKKTRHVRTYRMSSYIYFREFS